MDQTREVIREVTLNDILECIKEQNKKITNAKDETNAKLEKFMGTMDLNFTEVRKDVTTLNTIMEEREHDNQARQDKFEEKIIEMEKKLKMTMTRSTTNC